MIDYLEQGRKINCADYAGELRWRRLKIARKRRGDNWLPVFFSCRTAPMFTCQKLP